MDRAVAAEDEDGIGLVCGIEFVAGKHVDARQLKTPDIALVGVESQQGNGAHGERVAQRGGKSKSGA